MMIRMLPMKVCIMCQKAPRRLRSLFWPEYSRRKAISSVMRPPAAAMSSGVVGRSIGCCRRVAHHQHQNGHAREKDPIQERADDLGTKIAKVRSRSAGRRASLAAIKARRIPPTAEKV